MLTGPGKARAAVTGNKEKEIVGVRYVAYSRRWNCSFDITASLYDLAYSIAIMRASRSEDSR